MIPLMTSIYYADYHHQVPDVLTDKSIADSMLDSIDKCVS